MNLVSLPAGIRPRAKSFERALRLLEEREQARDTALEELRGKLRRGIDPAERGEFRDGDAVFEQLRELSARRRAESRK